MLKYNAWLLLVKIIIGVLLYLPTIALLANTSNSQSVPDPLQSWVSWVLHEQQNKVCPHYYNQPPFSFDQQQQSNEPICYWPSYLELTVTNQQGQFRQIWQVYAPGWINLPGDKDYWPQQVKLNGNPALVADRNEIPSVFVAEGEFVLEGQFHWEERPKSLSIPIQTGLVNLIIDNVPVDIPQFDEQGRLWLNQQDSLQPAGAANENRLDLKVYRQIIDEIPLQVVTRIDLEVAGHHREVLLGPAVLAKQHPMSLESPLPARLETDGRLRLQVRPGSWTIILRTRQEGQVEQLNLSTPQNQWTDEEVWVFEARNDLRMVEIEGVAAIDPQQTSLPGEWRFLPAYQIHPEEIFKLIEKRRGDPQPIPDQLQLERHFWLDFDGHGYSIQDHITGTMTRGWRLEMQAPAILGRVGIYEENQFITRLKTNSQMGVEVRRGQIELLADSRLEDALSQLPATGWDHDFHQVGATLHLPPGWRLFSAQGVDKVPDTWVEKWTLLDLFIVLILAAAMGKLWRWWLGVLTFMTLVLIYHEPHAPLWVWLNIIVAMALLRVLPTLGWLSTTVRLYQNLSLIALVILAFPFMIQQARQSIYPQLEYYWKSLEVQGIYKNNMGSGGLDGMYPTYSMDTENISEAQVARQAPIPQEQQGGMNGMYGMYPMYGMGAGKTPEAQVAPTTPIPQEQQEIYKQGDEYPSLRKGHRKQKALVQIDPNAQVQTGPGLPQWGWLDIPMYWSGPVTQNQSVQLWLLSPTVNRLLGWLRVGLVALLTGFLIWQAWSGTVRRLLQPQPLLPSTTWLMIVSFSLGIICLTSTTISFAEEEVATPSTLTPSIIKVPIVKPYPPRFLLEELQARLLTPPKCLPTCASSPRLLLKIDRTQLSGQMEIHTLAAVAVPLPGSAQQWLPQQIVVDGELAAGLRRDENGQIWLNLTPGIHQIQFAGTLPHHQTVQLVLPLKPHFVDIQNQGWHIEGIHENGTVDDQLQFTRTDETQLATLEVGHLDPFVRIERTLQLGLDWQVETKVVRLTPMGSPVVLKIPLLPGESVTSAEVRVEGGQVLVNLSPTQAITEWISVFDKQETINLIAPINTFSTETWRVDTSAIWHIEIEGIPIVHHQNAEGQWLPEWRPWPGEQITLHLTRPQGVTGQVLTIDKSHLLVNPGQHITDSTLTLNLRSSRGGQHPLILPENAELQVVKINGESQPIRQEGRIITLPFKPGKQLVEIAFRQLIGIQPRLTTPTFDLGLESVNTNIQVSMPDNRWILWVGGQPIGPAVMIWGVLIVIIIAAIGLGQISLTPLKTYQWLLLGMVLSQVPVPMMLSVVAWFMALGWRKQLAADTPAWQFNLIQVGLGILTLIALSTLILAIEQGLLGHPEMHIAGNGSDAHQLLWYQDRTDKVLPQVWVLSLPLYVYQIAMLLWALWLSLALLQWLKWGWQCFNRQGLWKKLLWKKKSLVS
ncbi:MAG: hypothetical protein HC877_10655 [Thioploca sp.]|nr:hypothetical protein [Thioploca sp.]